MHTIPVFQYIKYLNSIYYLPTTIVGKENDIIFHTKLHKCINHIPENYKSSDNET